MIFGNLMMPVPEHIFDGEAGIAVNDDAGVSRIEDGCS